MRDLIVHFDANVVEHINDSLVVMLPVPFLLLQEVPDFVERLREVLQLIERLQLLQSVLDLRLDLFPLQVVVFKNRLDLLDDPLLVVVKLLLLHPERALDVLEQVLCGHDLPVGLPPLAVDDLPDVGLLEVQLALHLGHHQVDAVDGPFQLLELRGDAVAEVLLELVEVVDDVLVHDLVRLDPALLLRLEDVLDVLELLLHLLHTLVLLLSHHLYFKLHT